MSLSTQAIFDRIVGKYKELNGEEKFTESVGSLQYIAEAAYMNQFHETAKQNIFETFGFSPDKNSSIAREIGDTIKNMIIEDNPNIQITTEQRDGAYALNYSRIKEKVGSPFEKILKGYEELLGIPSIAENAYKILESISEAKSVKVEAKGISQEIAEFFDNNLKKVFEKKGTNAEGQLYRSEQYKSGFYGIEDGISKGAELWFPIEILNEDGQTTRKVETGSGIERVRVIVQLDYFPYLGLLTVLSDYQYESHNTHQKGSLLTREVQFNLNNQTFKSISTYYDTEEEGSISAGDALHIGFQEIRPDIVIKETNADTNPAYKEEFLKRMTALNKQLTRPTNR